MWIIMDVEDSLLISRHQELDQGSWQMVQVEQRQDFRKDQTFHFTHISRMLHVVNAIIVLLTLTTRIFVTIHFPQSTIICK